MAGVEIRAKIKSRHRWSEGETHLNVTILVGKVTVRLHCRPGRRLLLYKLSVCVCVCVTDPVRSVIKWLILGSYESAG